MLGCLVIPLYPFGFQQQETNPQIIFLVLSCTVRNVSLEGSLPLRCEKDLDVVEGRASLSRENSDSFRLRGLKVGEEDELIMFAIGQASP